MYGAKFEIELLCKFTPSEMVQMLHNLEVEFGIETKEQKGA